MRRRLATLFVFVAAIVSISNLAGCAETAKEDPAEEQNQKQEVQPQVRTQPEQTQPTEVEQTDRTIGKNIEG